MQVFSRHSLYARRAQGDLLVVVYCTLVSFLAVAWARARVVELHWCHGQKQHHRKQQQHRRHRNTYKAVHIHTCSFQCAYTRMCITCSRYTAFYMYGSLLISIMCTQCTLQHKTHAPCNRRWLCYIFEMLLHCGGGVGSASRALGCLRLLLECWFFLVAVRARRSVRWCCCGYPLGGFQQVARIVFYLPRHIYKQTETDTRVLLICMCKSRGCFCCWCLCVWYWTGWVDCNVLDSRCLLPCVISSKYMVLSSREYHRWLRLFGLKAHVHVFKTRSPAYTSTHLTSITRSLFMLMWSENELDINCKYNSMSTDLYTDPDYDFGTKLDS